MSILIILTAFNDDEDDEDDKYEKDGGNFGATGGTPRSDKRGDKRGDSGKNLRFSPKAHSGTVRCNISQIRVWIAKLLSNMILMVVFIFYLFVCLFVIVVVRHQRFSVVETPAQPHVFTAQVSQQKLITVWQTKQKRCFLSP